VAKYLKEDVNGIGELKGTFKGIVVGFRTTIGKTGHKKTVILKPVTSLDGKIIRDQICCNLTKSLEKLDLQEGDVIRFNATATVISVRCKYEWEEIDYKFSKLGKIEKSE